MLLLDSHVLIWLLRGDGRLGSKTEELLVSQHPVYYSAVSVLELTIKALMGRIDLPNTLSAALEEEGLRQMPLTGEHAELLADFPGCSDMTRSTAHWWPKRGPRISRSSRPIVDCSPWDAPSSTTPRHERDRGRPYRPGKALRPTTTTRLTWRGRRAPCMRSGRTVSSPAGLCTPGSSPACAISRRHTRHRPNLRYTECGRPHLLQRVLRTANLGFCWPC